MEYITQEQLAVSLEYITMRMIQTMDSLSDRTIQTFSNQIEIMNKMQESIQTQQQTIYILKQRVDELEERIEELEGDNMEEDDTIQMCNEVVDAIENGNDDDFLSSYLKLTESLKAEVREDIKNEERW